MTSEHSGTDEHSDHVDLYRRLFFDESGMPSISRAVQAVPFSSYGLEGNPLDLRVCDASFPVSLPDAQIGRVTFCYARPTSVQHSGNFEISSFPTQKGQVRWESHPLSHELMLYGLDAEEEAKFGSPQVVQDEVVVSGMPFTLELRFWTQPHQLAQFYLECEETTLFGRAFSLSLQEVTSLLKQLVMVNGRSELLAQYQAEWEQSFKLQWRQS